MAMLAFGAYFDESYSTDEPRVMAIGGYLSPIEQWERFGAEWSGFFQEFAIQNPFHMTDFMAGRGQFFGWPATKRTRCMQWLAGIIVRRAHYRASVSLEIAAYEDVFRDSAVGPYAFCVVQWMQEAFRFLDRHNTSGQIAYVFESGSGFGGQIFAALDWIKKRRVYKGRYRLHSFTFADKRDALPLQAADILAWGTRRHTAGIISGDPTLPEPLRLLASKGKHKGMMFRRPELLKWKDTIRQFENENDMDELTR